MSRLKNTLIFATAFGLAGCGSAAPSGEWPAPGLAPMPHETVPVNADKSPTCSDLQNIQIIADSRGAQTVRNTGSECVAVFIPFNREAVGSIAMNAVFGITCADARTGGWLVAYGPDYRDSGAVYPTPALAEAYAKGVVEGENPIFDCTELPHTPYKYTPAASSH
jgi:hypothetical protein